MNVLEEIKKVAAEIPAELQEKNGLYILEYTVAERKMFLSKKKLVYTAKFRINDDEKEIKFTERLKETGFGFAAGGQEAATPGFGFKSETYKTTIGPREGTIREQSNLFGKLYTYAFDFGTIRNKIEEAAKEAGYKFIYKITAIGL